MEDNDQYELSDQEMKGEFEDPGKLRKQTGKKKKYQPPVTKKKNYFDKELWGVVFVFYTILGVLFYLVYKIV